MQDFDKDINPQPKNQPEGHKGKDGGSLIGKAMRKLAGRGALGGLGSTLMALPALAQATIEELYAFQFAETIPGVRSVKLLDNGDVQLKLADGRLMVVSAEQVQILDGGAIMIAEEVVTQIAQFSAAAEVGGAAAGTGISGTGALLGGLGLAGAAAAGAGGGGSSGGGDDDTQPVVQTPPPPPAPRFPSLNLAELQSDALNATDTETTVPDGTDSIDVTIGSLTKTVTPDSDGDWTLSLTASEAGALPQGVTDVTIQMLDDEGAVLSETTVTYDIDTIPPNLAITGFSSGPVLNAAEQGTDMTVFGTTDAQDGQTVTVELDGQTYTTVANAGQWSVTVPAADLASLADGTSFTVIADVSDLAGNPAVQASNSFASDFTAPTLTLDVVAGGQIDLVDVGGDLTLTGATNAADGQTVTVTLDGQAYTGLANSGSWSVTIPNAGLSGLSTGTDANITVAVSDQAGNPATPVTVTVPVDLTGPSIAISALPVGSTLNAVESATDLTITGTTGNVSDGQQVTVTLDGQTYTGSVLDGDWSVTVPAADLTALPDDPNHMITADVMDSDGITAPQASVTIAKDTAAPSLSIDGLSSGAVLNAAEAGTDLTVSGQTSAEDGQSVSVQVGSKTYTATVTGGNWSATVPPSDLAALPDATTVNITANVSDVAGNPAATANSSFQTDFTAPSIAITGLSDGAVMNAAEQGTDLTISGNSDAADGTVVDVTLTRADGTVDVSGSATVSGGLWSLTVPSSQLSALQTAEVYDVTASVADAAGNRNTASDSFSTDFVAPTVALDALPVGSTLDIAERASDLTLSGTTTAEDTQTVSVTLGGQTYTAAVSAGTWSTVVSSADLAALSHNTNYTITANVQDAAGNAASAATTSLTTDFRPVLALDDIGTNQAVSIASAQSAGLSVSGTSVGLGVGQVVNVSLNGSPLGNTTVGADGSWSFAVPSTEFTGLSAGDDLNFEATAVVAAGLSPTPASGTATAHETAAYVISEVARSGSDITLAIHADPDRDVSGGFFFTADLEYDPSVVTFDLGSEVANPVIASSFFANQDTSSTIKMGAFSLASFDLSEPVVTFTLSVQDASQPVELNLLSPEGGPIQVLLGTGSDDILTADDTDTIIQGGAGNDVIDVTAAGRDAIVFNPDPAQNGTDTILGFSLGTAAEISDTILFNGLDVSTLRGDGSGFETLAVGDAIGANTGVIGLTTQLADLDTATVEAAVEGLTGELAGDEIFVLASDGTDSVLVKVAYSGTDQAAVDTIAQFTGMSDLTAFSADNILHTDPTGATA